MDSALALYSLERKKFLMMLQELPRSSEHVPPASAPPTILVPEAVAALVCAARNVPTNQLLDLSIVRVQSLRKERGQVPPPPAPSPLRFPIVPLSASLLAEKGEAHG